MRNALATGLVVVALALVPIMGFAKTSTKQTSAAAHSSRANHATRGVVKSIDDSTLLVTRAGRHGADMTFTLNSSTHRDGTINVGTPVSIRYRNDGKTHVATSIAPQRTKQQAAASTAKPAK